MRGNIFSERKAVVIVEFKHLCNGNGQRDIFKHVYRMVKRLNRGQERNAFGRWSLKILFLQNKDIVIY